MNTDIEPFNRPPTSTRRQNPVETLAFLLVALLAIGGFVVGRSDRAEAATFQIANTGGDRVKMRDNPTGASSFNGYANPGSNIDVLCQQWGEAQGPRGNTLWFRVKGSGRTGWWVSDTWTNSPHLAADKSHGVAGVSWCNAAPVLTPAPPSGTYLNSPAPYRPCTNVNLLGCTSLGTIEAQNVTMVCWIDDSTVNERYNSQRWFYVTASNGIRGFVHSSRVERQTIVNHCGEHRGISAARWAAERSGQVSPGPGETTVTTQWSGYCYLFATVAYQKATGTSPKTNQGTAANAFRNYQREGRASSNMDPNAIPVGSIIFWTFGSSGHAAIYLGQGLIATTVGNGNRQANTIRAMNGYPAAPAGWVAPERI